MKKIIVSLLGLSLLGLANANEKTGNLKSSAIMQSTCLISASPIGFGAVNAPLLAQTAQSDMNLKCSNASAYTIELSYGGIYGTGSYSTYSIKANGTNDVGYLGYNSYSFYDNSGANIGEMSCVYKGGGSETIHFSSVLIAQLYGYTTSGWQSDSKKTGCVTNGTKAGTHPVGWVGAYNAPGNQPIGESTGYSYGVMQGSFKGDKLAYSIAVPGDINKVWNVGTNSYKSTGNGDNQIIPLTAKIVPDKSGSKYPAPDMYLDTVTAVISY